MLADTKEGPSLYIRAKNRITKEIYLKQKSDLQKLERWTRECLQFLY